MYLFIKKNIWFERIQIFPTPKLYFLTNIFYVIRYIIAYCNKKRNKQFKVVVIYNFFSACNITDVVEVVVLGRWLCYLRKVTKTYYHWPSTIQFQSEEGPSTQSLLKNRLWDEQIRTIWLVDLFNVIFIWKHSFNHKNIFLLV